MVYWSAIHTGVGFITHADREAFNISGGPGNVYVTDDSAAATAWAARNGATELTQGEAEAVLAALPPDVEVPR